MIKVVIIDLSKTTFKSNLRLQDGIEDLVSFCKDKGLCVAFVTNSPIYALRLSKSKLKYDCLVTPKLVSKKKPSPEFIYYIENKLHLPKDTFIYIGDNDNTDAICASHARVLYFSAKWANPSPRYGIPVESPASVKNYIQKYLLKEKYWGWKLEKFDTLNNRLRALAILDCDSFVRKFAVDTFKWGKVEHKPFFLNHLISSVYLSRIHNEVDYWATYPSHNVGGSLNTIMKHHITIISKEFRDKYVDLFVRYKTSINSGASRSLGVSVDFQNQIGTVHLNSNFKGELENKNILVLDDFITKGFSGECARNLLYKAGARDVICIGIGKYGNSYTQVVINSDFDPFCPIDIGNIRFKELLLRGNFDPAVTTGIEEHFRTMIESPGV